MCFFILLMVVCLVFCVSILEFLQICLDELCGLFCLWDIYLIVFNVECLIGFEDCCGLILVVVRVDLLNYFVLVYCNGCQGWVVVWFYVYFDGSVYCVWVVCLVLDGVFDCVVMFVVLDWEFCLLDGVDILENCVVMFEFCVGDVCICQLC